MQKSSRRRMFRQAAVGLTGAALLPGVARLHAATPWDLAGPSAEPATDESPGGQDWHSAYHKPPVTFYAHRLGTDHAEGTAVMDIDGDGRLDVTSGAYWYENPGSEGGPWKMHKYREIAPPVPGATGKAAEQNKAFWTEFVADNGEFAIDVNKDGAPDLVTSSWQNDGIWWFENPRKTGVLWEPHFICHSVTTEGMVEADILGDGKPNILAAHYGRTGLIWINFSGSSPVVHHVGGHEQDGHGVGVADIDGDGKPDIMSPFGWFKNIDAAQNQWEWQAEWQLGETGFPIIGYDVNQDGKMDLIYGHGHDYGLYWLEQTMQNDKRAWQRHLIDDSFSQVHALKMADIDGDGEPELIAGKRYRGHNGHDAGSYEPLCIYYYKIDRSKPSFERFTVSYNGTAEAGTQIVVTDIDGDGDLDIIVAGKTGVHWLESLKVNKRSREAREKELLLRTEGWPFPGENS
jgi:FG-GAP-like repeat